MNILDVIEVTLTAVDCDGAIRLGFAPNGYWTVEFDGFDESSDRLYFDVESELYDWRVDDVRFRDGLPGGLLDFLNATYAAYLTFGGATYRDSLEMFESYIRHFLDQKGVDAVDLAGDIGDLLAGVYHIERVRDDDPELTSLQGLPHSLFIQWAYMEAYRDRGDS